MQIIKKTIKRFNLNKKRDNKCQVKEVTEQTQFNGFSKSKSKDFNQVNLSQKKRC